MTWRAAWLASIALGVVGCAGSGDTQQVLTGNVGSTADAIAIRAVTGTSVVAAAEVASDGSFTLAVPVGHYRLEMLTASGVRPVVVSKAGVVEQLAFRVCVPGGPWGLGTIGGDPTAGGAGGPQGCDPSTGSACPPPPPPGCIDANGNVGSGSDCPPPPPPWCDPSTGSACPPPPPWCDPSTGSACPPPPCIDANGNVGSGSDCVPPPPPPGCDPSTGSACPPPDGGGSGGPGCYDAAGNPCPPPPPPCGDPTDPSTCQDPCMADPTSCGCGSDDPTCWPPPDPNGGCNGGMSPSHPPGDFGCGAGPTGS